MGLLNCLLTIHNAGLHLEESLESLFNQTFKDFEILAFDNGSTDNSLSILKRFQKKNRKIHLFSSKETLETPCALNQLMKVCKSRYFAFHGAYDLSSPNRFEKQMERMRNSTLIALGTSICFDGSWVGKETFIKKGPLTARTLLAEQTLKTPHHAIWHPTGLYSNAILKKKIFFDEKIPAFYDLLFHAEIQHHFPLRMSNLEECLYTLRLYPNCPEELIGANKLKIEFDQLEKSCINKLFPIYLRYISDARLTPAVSPF